VRSVRAGGGRRKVAINGGGALKLQTVWRSMEVWSTACVAGRRNGVCRREEDWHLRGDGYAEVAMSDREAVAAAVATKTTAAAETPATASQD
jgi:hypothetical protein